jgi:guanylate kinase
MSAIFIVSAPSGSGKSTLVKGLLATLPDLRFSVSYTTRAPRESERHGENYYFTGKECFEAMIERGEFLEYAGVFGHYYGTHCTELDHARGAGKDLVLDIDVQGAAQLKKKVPEAISIFILAPSRAELEQRLRARSEDSDEVIRRRLKGAVEEIRNYELYDYVLINREVTASIDVLASIVKAERTRRIRMEQQIRPILDTFEK